MSSGIPVVALIQRAHREGWAAGQFNMSSLDTLHGIIDAANATRIPCLVGLSLTTLRYVGLEYVAGLVPAARNQATVPLYFHLDHGADLDDVRQVVAAGFDSVMIDTSMLWTAVWPGLALAVVMFGTNMFGDALRDLLDPKLRGGIGRFAVPKKQRRAA